MSIATPDVAAAVRLTLAELGGDPWDASARDVRLETERRLCLPADALAEMRNEVFTALRDAIVTGGPAAAHAGATAHHLRMLCSSSCLPANAAASLEELEKALAEVARAKEALQPELDMCAVLCAYLLSEEPQLPTMALRVLTAASMHGGGCTAALLQAKGLRDDSGLLEVLLGRLPRAGDALSILMVALLNNLADTPANQMRIVASGALAALAQLVLDPAASGVLKEHALTAAAAMGGMAGDEVNFPQVVGRLCASRLPGTQREAVRAMEILADKAPLRPQLARIEEIVTGLRAAQGSRDAAAAKGASETLALLGL